MLHSRLVDTETTDSRLTVSAPIASEADLVRASADVAVKVLMFLQLQTQAGDKDLRPWIASRVPKLDAVKAFLQANAEAYQAKDGTEPFLRRAINLDPQFIAPRVWLAVYLNARGNTEEARSHYAALAAQLPNASPFRRSMIAFTGARLRTRSGRAGTAS